MEAQPGLRLDPIAVDGAFATLEETGSFGLGHATKRATLDGPVQTPAMLLQLRQGEVDGKNRLGVLA